MSELCCDAPDPIAARGSRGRLDAVTPYVPSLVWDSGQRHAARPWYRLCVLGVVLLLDLFVIAIAPFILANTDEPVATWIALALLAALTLKLAGEGLMQQSVRLERVSLDPAGLRLVGARLTIPGTAYRELDVMIDWGDVGSMDVVEMGGENRVSAVVDIRLGVASPFGTEFRLVQLNRVRAQAFADKALELKADAALPAGYVGDRADLR